eukprot:13846027-Heterocapsa_arctica.AAC.1
MEGNFSLRLTPTPAISSTAIGTARNLRPSAGQANEGIQLVVDRGRPVAVVGRIGMVPLAEVEYFRSRPARVTVHLVEFEDMKRVP